MEVVLLRLNEIMTNLGGSAGELWEDREQKNRMAVVGDQIVMFA